MARFKRQTKQTRKATAILTADWHIRPDVPVCRTDDYFAAMERKIDFILDLSKQHECPILIAGDLGNKPLNNGWPTWLLEWTINKFLFGGNFSRDYRNVICIPGQHDLPNHRLDLWMKSGIGVLYAAGAIQLLGPHELDSDFIFDKFYIQSFPYGESLHHILPDEKLEIPKIAITHQAVLSGKSVFDGVQAKELLKKFPEYDLIVSGDNHLAFEEELEGRRLVNPGSMMRNTADQIDHQPRVYLWYSETNEIKAVYLPIEKDVISREHIKDTTERDNRFDALITRVKTDVEIKLSYPKNITAYFKRYRTEQPVKQKVLDHVV